MDRSAGICRPENHISIQLRGIACPPSSFASTLDEVKGRTCCAFPRVLKILRLTRPFP